MNNPVPAQVRDLDYRYDGPIPANAAHLARMPQAGREYSAEEIAAAIEYARAECAKLYRVVVQCAVACIIARHPIHDGSLYVPLTQAEQFRIACNNLKRARSVRDAWVEREATR